MSRPKRELKKRFIVFCEGDTEYNYIDKMRKNKGVQVALKPINMHGGGYANFLEKIRTEAQSNCLAKFVIIDADRIMKHSGEKEKFKELLDYCRIQNQRGKIPHFLIVNNPDFEYIACLHDSSYKGENADRYIKNVFGVSSVQNFKGMAEIYTFLNQKERSYQNMLAYLRDKKKLVRNIYAVKRKTFDIVIHKTEIDWDMLYGKNSNIEEFFDVIDW
ncbi:hypothetical protein B5F07_08695 [Lachnoclostridium sp. An169]|uniref:RloB domain-containing protein n=1 Tax=Lachnoclostridium sp. An169 TaxID=1965569 RepID=UPI000B3A0D7D|nr:RloB domain-containing protein [Lachnoclostridium sp. An169]OUP84204.1 hypothetical protein B5F07_08695 [Lachnoclostridium sp. An169]